MAQFYWKVAKTVSTPKMPNTYYIKAQLESTKNLHQTTFETQRYFQEAKLNSLKNGLSS